MKAKILLPRERPKASRSRLRKLLEDAGMEESQSSADFGLVVGGDGVFSYFGRTEDIPLLFVGVRPTGSKAFMARVDLGDLPSVLDRIGRGEYGVLEERRLEVRKNGRRLGDTFTDVYLERGAESNSIRYGVRVSGPGPAIAESAIGDGVVVCTRAGSTGYFSYVDKVKGGEWLDPEAHKTIGRSEVGVCHLLPSYTERDGTERHPLRYTVPWGSTVELSVTRPSDARLYGVGLGKGGVRLGLKDVVEVGPSSKSTKLVDVRSG